MSPRRTLLRILVLLAVLLVLTTCVTPRMAMQKPVRGGSVPPVPDKFAKTHAYSAESYDFMAPVISVDTSGPALAVHPDPASSYDVSGPGGSPVRLWWSAPAGTDLTIQITPGCVRDLACANNVCSAVALPVELSHRHCKYDVMVPGKPTLDPDVIIVKCCTSGLVE